MAGVNTEYLGKHKKFRTDNKKLAAAFIALAVIIAVIVFWWLKLVGITVTGEAFCGLSEHTHSEDCYVSELVCGFSEDEIVADTSESTLPSEEDGTEEATETEETTEAAASAEYHSHSDECYEKTLVCELTEHIHTSDCYPDFSADVETESDWLATFEDVILTQSPSENLINIAKTQVDYKESELNFVYDEDGTKRGYTRYGEWYGNPYGNWNAMFVSFCLSYSNIENAQAVISSGAETMHQKWQTEELFESAESHEARVGEIVFIDSDKDSAVDRVAIISEVTEEEITIIAGDCDDSVKEEVIEDKDTIIGYGLTDNLTVAEEETTAEETTTEVETATTQQTTQESTTKETTTQEVTSTEEETSDTEETTAEIAEEHEHTDDCYTADNILACTEWGKTEPWALNRESDDFRDKAVKYVTYLINQVPEIDEFENKLDEYDAAEDYESYEIYYMEVYRLVSKAYVNYENLLLDLRELVPNREHLFNYEWLYTRMSTMAVTETRTVEFVNYYDNATSNKTVLIHSNNVGSYSSFGFYWWYAVVVDENEYGELVVTNKYGYELTDKSSLKPTTTKGFVLLSHGDSNTFDCEIGDEVTVDFDYLSSSGTNTSSFGTVTFSDYVPPETTTDPPTTEPDTSEEGDPVVEELTDQTPGEPSDTQVKRVGGKTTSGAGDVEISKSIDGTEIENIFDITLTVRTETNVQSYLAEPDMAVVIVMDISNTMNTAYPSGSSTSRYDAAVEAAENFMKQFMNETQGLSRIGFVAFNTHAHKIFELSPCSTEAELNALISEMESETENIIDNYVSDDRTRFTNVETGLKMGYDMLESSSNENKYIIFLSDGFPTTYYNPNDSDNSSDKYCGYDPYTSSGTKGQDGVFYDYVTGYYCSYGTSYSDKASIKARVMATNIKSLGAKIFSIGIDVGGQTIADYDGRTGLSVIDRTSTTYEIGDASSTAAYQNWLKNSIGSGYYYDSTAKDDIANAFIEIFEEIKALNEQSRYNIWTSTDPLPVFDEGSAIVEFIHFYDIDGNPAQSLTGTNALGAENTAKHESGVIYWDLKTSGYTTSEEVVDSVTTTYYYYSITYRVRLYNESTAFQEYTTYNTNGEAYLEYKTIVDTNGVKEISELKTLDFEKPAVEGYVAEFSFIKKSDLGDPLEGAVFTLTHDDTACPVCHGNGSPVTTVNPLTFTSIADGTVNFGNIPSGHIYILKETKPPSGYMTSGSTFSVQIDYDVLTVTETLANNTTRVWTGDDFEVSNPPLVYLLPETGGTGTLPLTIIGLALMAFPILYSMIRRKRERRFQ